MATRQFLQGLHFRGKETLVLLSSAGAWEAMLSLRAAAGLWSRRHQTLEVAGALVDWAEAQLEPPVCVKFEESGADRPALLIRNP